MLYTSTVRTRGEDCVWHGQTRSCCSVNVFTSSLGYNGLHSRDTHTHTHKDRVAASSDDDDPRHRWPRPTTFCRPGQNFDDDDKWRPGTPRPFPSPCGLRSNCRVLLLFLYLFCRYFSSFDMIKEDPVAWLCQVRNTNWCSAWSTLFILYIKKNEEEEAAAVAMAPDLSKFLICIYISPRFLWLHSTTFSHVFISSDLFFLSLFFSFKYFIEGSLSYAISMRL